MKKAIPIHNFTDEDTKGLPVRHVPLNVRNDYDIATPHRHNYYEVFFFTKGGGNHFIDFVKHPVADNSVHIVYPQQIHVLNREPSSFGAVVHFSRDLFGVNTENAIDALLNNNRFLHIANTAQQQADLNNVLEQLKAEYNSNDADGGILKSYLTILLLKCVKLFDMQHPGWQEDASGTYNSFRALVEEGYRTQKQPGYYADKLKITERKLNEICKKATGLTVGDYINNRVVLEAKRLLCNSPLTVKEVAFYLGFTDPSYFNRFFKRNMHTTALEFRRETEKAGSF